MTNDEEFLEFKKWFLYWQEYLGLVSWRILYFKHLPIDESGTPYARVNYITDQREAWVYFYGCGDGVREGWAKEKALHECLHLLFAPDNLSEGREHELINTGIRAILGNSL